MPETPKLAKALLVQLRDDKPDGATRLDVQFNPDSLRVSYGNQVVQPPAGTTTDAATQWVGQGSTRLALTLVFDVTVPPLDQDPKADVRKATAKVIDLMKVGAPRELAGEGAGAKPVTVFPPPKVRFDWGSFRFDGIVDSIEESLEHFSADGRPLRSSIQLALSTQKIRHDANPDFQASPAGAPSGGGAGAGFGLSASVGAGAGGTVQGMADAAGMGGRWQQIAAANGIENPRSLAAGQLVDLNARLG